MTCESRFVFAYEQEAHNKTCHRVQERSCALFYFLGGEIDMNQTRLILVEGLPGTGKTTISGWIYRRLKRKGVPAKVLREDDAGMPGDWDIDADKHLPASEYARRMLELWQHWAENHTDEGVLILDCAFMQNPLNEMMFRGAPDAQAEAYVRSIAAILEPYDPVCVYLRRESAQASIEFAQAAKGKGWASRVDKMLAALGCPDLFERRYTLESALLSSMDHVLCDVNGSSWRDAKKRIRRRLCPSYRPQG